MQRPLTRLSGLDASFLYAETATTPMNVIATVVIAASDDGSAPDFGAILRRVEARLPDLPPFRRRLVEAPLGLDHPVWIDAPDVDVRDHARRITAPAPGGPEELARVVAQVAARRLDRSRPLWELWLVDGLAEGRSALLLKTHHAALDGVSGAGLLLHLFDRDGETSVAPGLDETGPQAPGTAVEPSAARLLGHTLQQIPERARHCGEAFEAARRTLNAVSRTWLRSGSDTAKLVKPFSAPRTPFNRALTRQRRVAWSRAKRADLALVREAFGGSQNDVVLAACAASLRQYLLVRGALPERPLVAAMPISSRLPADGLLGNHISASLVELPVEIADPIERLARITRSTRAAKRFAARMGLRSLESLAEMVSPSIARPALQLYSRWQLADRHAPLHNVVISNVQGPPRPFSLAGAQVEAIHPHGPLMEGVGLNITVLGYAGHIDVGVLACPGAVDRVAEIADGVSAGIEALMKLAHEAPLDPYLA